jgi:DNA transformation protein
LSPTPTHPVLTLLQRLLPISPRSMFGGIGIYSDEIFFAILAGDQLFFKVDDHNRPDYQACGMSWFNPYGTGKNFSSYYQVPPHVLGDPPLLRQWALNSIDAARRSRKTKTARQVKPN